jgi:hypothetical protein
MGSWSSGPLLPLARWSWDPGPLVLCCRWPAGHGILPACRPFNLYKKIAYFLRLACYPGSPGENTQSFYIYLSALGPGLFLYHSLFMEALHMNRTEVLEAARHCVCGERQQDYGSPENNFANIAALWEAYAGRSYTPVEVAVMLALLKVARIKSGRKADNFVDLAGYAALAGELADQDQEPATEPAADQDQEPRKLSPLERFVKDLAESLAIFTRNFNL